MLMPSIYYRESPPKNNNKVKHINVLNLQTKL